MSSALLYNIYILLIEGIIPFFPSENLNNHILSNLKSMMLRGNASACTSARPVVRSAMLAGNFTASSTVYINYNLYLYLLFFLYLYLCICQLMLDGNFTASSMVFKIYVC